MEQSIKYCVVETIEDGEPYCSAVPESWIEREILRWPIKSADIVKGRKLGISPKENWQSVPCKLIRNGIENFQLALQLEARAEIMSSSSEELVHSLTKPQSDILDFNSLMEDIRNDTEVCEHVEVAEHIEDNRTATPVQNVPIFNANDNIVEATMIFSNNDVLHQFKCSDVGARFDSLDKTLAEIKITLDLIFEKMTIESNEKNESCIHDNEWQKFPLSSMDQIEEELEKQLRSDKVFKVNLKKKLAIFGGADEVGSAKIINKWLFKDSLLEQFSWAGTASKHPFNSFKEILEIIIAAVRVSHPTYTAHTNATFLKNYLKHAKFRQQHKNKPKSDEVVKATNRDKPNADPA